TGLEDGGFPHLRSLGAQQELEEERRLASVGGTRARHRLHLSRAATRSAWGQPQYNPPSRSLEESPEVRIRWERTAEAVTSWGGVGGRAGRAGAGSRRSARAAELAGRLGIDGTGLTTASELSTGVPTVSVGDRVIHQRYG